MGRPGRAARPRAAARCPRPGAACARRGNRDPHPRAATGAGRVRRDGVRIRPDTDALRATFLRGVGIGLPVGYEIGFDLYPASRSGAAPPDGFFLRPRLIGGAEQTIPIGANLGLTVNLDASAGDVLGVTLFPGSTDLVGGDVVAGTAIEIAATTNDPWYLVGTAATARIELYGPSLRLALEGTTDEAELLLQLDDRCRGPARRPRGHPDERRRRLARASAGSRRPRVHLLAGGVLVRQDGLRLRRGRGSEVQLPLDIRLGSNSPG